jgi:hypothetical protein
MWDMSHNFERQENNMAKRASEDNGYVTKTLDYGKVYMDQHKETLEAIIACVQFSHQQVF